MVRAQAALKRLMDIENTKRRLQGLRMLTIEEFSRKKKIWRKIRAEGLLIKGDE